MALRIEDYALIGDCKTAALVGRDGSIDWLCWPRFDSDACFASLLGTPDHGRWLIGPVESSIRSSRRYRDDTLILETEFRSNDGDSAASLVDFMPPEESGSHLVRMVIGRRGRMRFRIDLAARFDYGMSIPWVSRAEDGSINAVAGPTRLVLRTGIPLQGDDLRIGGEFTVAAGDNIPFVLSHAPSHCAPPEAPDPRSVLRRTQTFWRTWLKNCPEVGPWTTQVKRSMLTLKALTYAPTGGIVAAPTTSLPENPGGVRNWDYRYCWVRDATFTLLAFMNLGYYDEALAFRNWLLRAVAGSPGQVQTVYGVGGERRLPELELSWLPGYGEARPVRVGNAAALQMQLDVYGEIADAMVHTVEAGFPPEERALDMRLTLFRFLEEIWQQRDWGIWEVRGEPQQFTHSKVMTWVAFDRAARAIETLGYEGPGHHWRKVADDIRADVCRNAFDESHGTFVLAYGSKQVDASLLLLPLVGFLPPEDPRVRGTIAAVEERLLRDGLLLRYETDAKQTFDGLPPNEGRFVACSFWLVDNYVLQKRHKEARRLFERLISLCNDVGLLAEQYDPREGGRMLGNFPQAYSHVGLINSALNLEHRKHPGKGHVRRAQMPAGR
jgi:GH15 family glucan-1,4-alpha-glucosidase